MYKLFVSLRYLLSRVISYVAIGGMGLGVAVLIIVHSVMGGFQDEYLDTIRGTSSDITVDHQAFWGIRSPEELRDLIESVPGVAATAPEIENIVLVHSPLTQDYGHLRGIDIEAEKEVGDLEEYILSDREAYGIAAEEMRKDDLLHEAEAYEEIGAEADAEAVLGPELWERHGATPERPGLVVGVHLMRAFRLRFGDVVKLMTARDLESGYTEAEFTVAGAWKTGIYEEDRRSILARLEDVQGLIGVPGRLSSVAVRCSTSGAVHPVARSIEEAVLGSGSRDHMRKLLEGWETVEDGERVRHEGLRTRAAAAAGTPRGEALAAMTDAVRMMYARTAERSRPHMGVRVVPWDQLNPTLIRAVELEKWLLQFIIFFMIFLAGLNITSILTMSVVEKIRDLGIMKAVGGSSWGLMSIFLLQGFFITALGSTLGLVIGVAFVENINWLREQVKQVTGFEVFDPKVYYLDSIPTEMDPWGIAGIVLATVLLGFVLALIPAIKAARLDPIEALRYE